MQARLLCKMEIKIKGNAGDLAQKNLYLPSSTLINFYIYFRTFQSNSIRANRRPLTDHVSDHVVIQTSNDTLVESSIHVNSQDVNNVKR